MADRRRSRAAEREAASRLSAGDCSFDRKAEGSLYDHRKPPAVRWDLVDCSLAPGWQPAWSTGHLVRSTTRCCVATRPPEMPTVHAAAPPRAAGELGH